MRIKLIVFVVLTGLLSIDYFGGLASRVEAKSEWESRECFDETGTKVPCKAVLGDCYDPFGDPAALPDRINNRVCVIPEGQPKCISDQKEVCLEWSANGESRKKWKVIVALGKCKQSDNFLGCPTCKTCTMSFLVCATGWKYKNQSDCDMDRREKWCFAYSNDGSDCL